MKRSLGLAVSAFVMAGSAQSADFFQDTPQSYSPVAAGYNWAGGYIGAHAGYGWGDAEIAGIPDIDIDGWVGGIHAGYNYLYGSTLLGVEFDASLSGIDGGGFGIAIDNQWLASARGRLGYAMGRYMVYATGGLALAGAEANVGGPTASNTHVGWVGGLGAEAFLTENIVGRLEWLHYDVGDESYFGVAGEGHVDVLRVGASYKF